MAGVNCHILGGPYPGAREWLESLKPLFDGTLIGSTLRVSGLMMNAGLAQ
jgi:hypothetical protein